MSRIRILASTLALTSILAPVAGRAGLPSAVPDLPVLGVETPTGSIVRSSAAPVTPTAKTVDGAVDDWSGEITRLGGTSILSHGELVYQDYLGDAWGADDGFDAGRKQTLDGLKATEPRTYRIDALQQAAGAQFDAPRPVGAELHYGDTTAVDTTRTQADIEEVRVAADAEHLLVLVRTMAMTDPAATGVLLLLDTAPGGSYVLDRSGGGVTTAAEWAFVVHASGMKRVYHNGVALLIGCQDPCLPEPFLVAANPSGYVNALEIAIRRDFFDGLSPLPDALGIGVATGVADSGNSGFAAVRAGDARSDLLNVAFRREPARIWMDERQAFALWDGKIDEFLSPVTLSDLSSGVTQTFAQRPGYYEAVYVNAGSPVNFEARANEYFQGPYQHYGLYLPSAYRHGATLPATWWMHYRGGHAHDAAAWEPGILREFGEEIGAIVVTPSARGTSSWYTGRGMVDFLDVWGDANARWPIDADRVYLAGHSMGGWASNFLGVLFPDRWAASNPQDGLLVPGLWTGVGEPTRPQQGADIQAEFLYPLLENARNVPYAILHGTADELVPVTGAIAQGQRFHDLGYRYRTYLFHAYEHYSAPIWDDWREIVRYMTGFRRDRDPARVTYRIRPALDHAVSTVSVPAGVDLGYRFDRAYWTSQLRTRTAGIAPSNIGEIDATTFGRGVPNVIPIPEAGTGGQAEPYTMHGQAWLPNGAETPQNRFTARLTNLSSGTLDVARMGLGTAQVLTATVTTDGPSEVRLAGSWSLAETVEGASSSYDGGVLVLSLPAAGTYQVTITP